MGGTGEVNEKHMGQAWDMEVAMGVRLVVNMSGTSFNRFSPLVLLI